MNFLQRRARALVVLCLTTMLAVSLVLAPSAAEAGAKERYAQQLQQFRTMLEEQSKLDTMKLAVEDRENLSRWMDEVEVLLAKGDLDEVRLRMRRIEYGLDLVRAVVARSSLLGQAEKQEQAYHTAVDQVEQLNKEIEEMRARKKKLQAELQRLR